jgi:hypothetical protein
MSELVASGFGEFDRLAVMYRRTLALLDQVTATGALPADATSVLASQTLPHVEDMEAGFRVWLRASHADLVELRAMVERAGVTTAEPQTPAEQRAALIERMQALAATRDDLAISPAPARYLAALELARLVFALLPATPADEVHYPVGLRAGRADRGAGAPSVAGCGRPPAAPHRFGIQANVRLLRCRREADRPRLHACLTTCADMLGARPSR